VVAVRDDGQLRVLAHDSGSVEVIYHCFAGETRYLTKEGTKTFAETAGTVQEVLTSAGIANDRGRWAEAIIHSFGPQPVMTVRLRRNKVVKTIRATHNHEWNILGRNKAHRVVTTQDLKPGMRMAHLRARGYFYEPEHEAIRMGFVFGDGAILQRPQQTYGVAVLWGPKRDLAKYFDEVCTTAPRERTTINDVPGLAYTSGMVGYTKTLPPLTAPLEYLHGWLMGYFAADGSVTKTNISMTSSVLENLQHVRDVAILLGIGTYSITSKWRTGFGVTSQIHTLGFSGKDMGTSFFLRHDHQDAYDLRDERGTNDRERFGWTVDAIEDTGEVTPVYCARVPETGTFVLEDNIWTRNCPFCGSGQVIARSDGTVMCEFCNSSFTVQVQPEFSAFPQTVDGQPVQIPGLPPDSNQDAGGLPPDEGAPGDPTAEDNVPNDAEENGPPEDGDNTEDEPIDSGGNPLFNKHSYRTASGHALSELEYVRHLALKITPDRKNVLARIRLERAAGD
jgi:ribosomal protein L37AE/L43A